MKEIEKGIYIEDIYPGTLLAAVVTPKGILMIDAPPHPDDGRSWQAALRSIGTGSNRILTNLDAHPDRMLGNRAMNATIVAHEETARIAALRSAIFKAQSQESGAEWEDCPGLSGIRWLLPSLMFTNHLIINWSDWEIIIEHHPGSEPGSSWVVIPKANIVFIGDTVVLDQPPFLSNAIIPLWLESLELLLTDYRNYTIISSRSGQVPEQAIRDHSKYLKDLHKRVERLAKRNSEPEDTEKLIPRILSRIKYPQEKEEKYTQRLKYGLYHHFINQYRPELGDS